MALRVRGEEGEEGGGDVQWILNTVLNRLLRFMSSFVKCCPFLLAHSDEEGKQFSRDSKPPEYMKIYLNRLL